MSTLRTMKWGTASSFLIVAVAVAPRRAIWDSFAVATFDNHTALVIGTTRDELLLYAPNEPGRPRFRVRKDAPGRAAHRRDTGALRPSLIAASVRH